MSSASATVALRTSILLCTCSHARQVPSPTWPCGGSAHSGFWLEASTQRSSLQVQSAQPWVNQHPFLKRIRHNVLQLDLRADPNTRPRIYSPTAHVPAATWHANAQARRASMKHTAGHARQGRHSVDRHSRLLALTARSCRRVSTRGWCDACVTDHHVDKRPQLLLLLALFARRVARLPRLVDDTSEQVSSNALFRTSNQDHTGCDMLSPANSRATDPPTRDLPSPVT